MVHHFYPSAHQYCKRVYSMYCRSSKSEISQHRKRKVKLKSPKNKLGMKNHPKPQKDSVTTSTFDIKLTCPRDKDRKSVSREMRVRHSVSRVQ